MNTVRCTPPQCWLCTRRNNNKLHLKQKTPSSCLSLYKGPLNTFCHKCWPFSQLAKGLCLQDPAPLLWKCESVIRSVVSDSLLPQECSLPGSSVHGVFQARILEWVVIPFSRGSSQPRAWTCCLLHRREILYHLSHHGRPYYHERGQRKENLKLGNSKLMTGPEAMT